MSEEITTTCDQHKELESRGRKSSAGYRYLSIEIDVPTRLQHDRILAK